jgi:predicted RNA binding protein YcfA (HicA-like mRNA interferase family)
MHKDIRDLVRSIEAVGYTVIRDNGRHVKIYNGDGNYVYSLPSTPGRGRWKQNLMSELRKRGVHVAV